LKDDPHSFQLRRCASACFSRLADLAGGLDLSTAARLGSDWSMWLDLKDPSMQEDSRRRLEECLAEPEPLLRRFLWAKQCGIDVDLTAVDREIERQVALTGGKRFEHAAARIAMAMVRDEPMDAVKYIERHREHLLRHLDATIVLGMETEMLARSGEKTRARARLSEAERAGMDHAISARLHTLIDLTGGQDGVLAAHKANFERSGSIVDLRALTAAYAECEAFGEVIELGKRLVERSGDAGDARMLVIALYESGQQDKALEVFDIYPVLRADRQMQILHARILFELGRLQEAAKALNALRSENDSEAARLLLLQLKITAGDWEALQAYVEEQWSYREERSAVELLQAGQIAQFIGASRGEALVRQAANGALDDPAILAACYHAATSAGWEDDATVASWIARAAELSDSSDGEGPVQRASFDQIVKKMPEWEARETRIIEKALRGEIPLFLVAQSLNRSLTQLVLSQALWNANQSDVRKKTMVLTTSGKARPASGDLRSVALDPVALLTISMIGFLEACRETFDRVVVSHETLAWLFEERTQLRFHQPSQVHAAHALQRSVTDGTVRIHEATGPAPESLFREVGRTLAELFTEAATIQDDGREQIVVVGGPIWKVGSAMSVAAELGEYDQHVCSTADIVDALSVHGVLTEGAIAAARRVHKRPEGAIKREVPKNSILLLDDTAASLLSHSNLLNWSCRGLVPVSFEQCLL
jgi:tetratricopeptide (TPR) repeat protein